MPWEPQNIFQDQDKKYQWHTRGENCPYCDAMEGRIYTLDVYMTSGVYPGFHKGCNCYMVEMPSDTQMSDLDIFGSALNMRNEGWLAALFGRWDRLWIPGWYTNPHNLLANATPGMTASEALRLANQARTYGMFEDYGFPGNIFYPWNTNRNVNKSSWRPAADLLRDIYAGVRLLQTGGYMATVISGKSGLFLTPPALKPLSPAQTYHNNTYSLGGGR